MIRSTGKKFFVYCLVLAVFSWSITPVFGKKRKEGDDTVLRSLCQGTIELYNHNYEAAAKQFDVATYLISAIWGDSPDAKAARSIWYEEKVKPFKGEPYERMMAYYYRGLLYLMDNDYGNAQACFRQSVMQDAFAEEDQHRADVILPLYLQGYALMKQGSIGEASTAFDFVKRSRPDIELPSIDNPPNTILIVETGRSPRKVADGVGSYQLKFFRGKKFKENRAVCSLTADSTINLYPIEDIFWQASTRGGRAVDKIIDGKVAFRQSTESIGSVLTDISSEFIHDPNYGEGAEELGLALGVVGIGALLLSSKAKPAVDTRYWDNLPDAVHVAALRIPPGDHTFEFNFSEHNGESFPELTQSVGVTINDNNNIILVSSRDKFSKRYSK